MSGRSKDGNNNQTDISCLTGASHMFPAWHTPVSTSSHSFLPLRTSMKNCRFSSIWTKFEPSSAGLVCGPTHLLPTVWFWFAVQANTPKNQTELNFSNPIWYGKIVKQWMLAGQNGGWVWNLATITLLALMSDIALPAFQHCAPWTEKYKSVWLFLSTDHTRIVPTANMQYAVSSHQGLQTGCKLE